MAQYYTLEEAAKLLRMTPDKLREMVRQGKLRGFQDKGTLRFRAHEVEELARTLGIGSDPELQLGDSAAEKKGGSSKRKQPPTPSLSLDDDDDKKTPRKPTMVKPPVGSDSDVRLVVDDFSLDDEAGPASSTRKGKKGDKKPAKPDSGLNLLPMEEDSDVKLVPDDDEVAPPSGSRRNTASKRPSDSDIRLDSDDSSDEKYDPLVTEEIDLDLEEQRASQPKKKSKLDQPNKKKSKLDQPRSGSNLPTSSPFELSEDDIVLDLDPNASGASGKKKTDSGGKKSDSGKKKPAPLSMSLDDEPLTLAPDDSDEIALGMEPRDDAGQSGINLTDPADSGPSLEDDGSSDMELALSPIDSGSSKKGSRSGVGKKKKKDEDEDSSEFELTLDEGDESEASTGDDSSSEFELTLDEGEPDLADSSSEFELTLDDDDSGASVDEGDEKDIFETNLDVPALEDESGSVAMPLESTDEDMDESSEFELDLDDASEGDEDESGSAVVPIDDDEDVDDAAATARGTAARRKRKLADDDDEGDEDVEEDEDEDEEVAAAPDAKPAPWGVFPTLMLMPTVVVLFLVGLMAFEMIRGMWGYHRGTKVSDLILRPIAKMVDDKLPE